MDWTGNALRLGRIRLNHWIGPGLTSSWFQVLELTPPVCIGLCDLDGTESNWIASTCLDSVDQI